MKTLVLNLGSTSTKIGVFEGTKPLAIETIRHASLPKCLDEQKEARKCAAMAWLKAAGYDFSDISVIAARGGMVRPVPGGLYLVDEAAAQDAASGKYGEHASNVGLLIAREWGEEYGVPAVFADPPTTDEMAEVARITGVKGLYRRSVFHALNCKRAVRGWCEARGKNPHDMRFVVAHMGGGVTVAAVDALKVIDVTNGLDGEGPLTPERSGALPVGGVVRLMEEYGGDAAKLLHMLTRQAGLRSWFGTSDVGELARRARGEPEVRLVLDAMLYNVAKHIGAMAAVLRGRVDQVLLTGGIANEVESMEKLASQVGWIAPVTVLPGEDELGALAEAAQRFVDGVEEAKSVAG